MHSHEVRARVLELVGEGANDCEISRLTGIPRSTVREMRITPHDAGGRSLSQGERCSRCWKVGRPVRFSPSQYAELLGVYLGDGHIVEAGRTHRLRIFFDSRYPRILDETQQLLAGGLPLNSVVRQCAHGGRMTILSVYSQHLPCLLPQHGPGRKHLRSVSLEPWQREIAAAHPWPLIRGLIRSDGCSFINRTGPYEYLSYDFCNCSAEIADVLCGALDRVGVLHRRTHDRGRRLHRVRINRRESVARMVAHIGVKE